MAVGTKNVYHINKSKHHPSLCDSKGSLYILQEVSEALTRGRSQPAEDRVMMEEPKSLSWIS